jgi:ATP-dependent Lhr-like helicase
LALRADLPELLAPLPDASAAVAACSDSARLIYAMLAQRGASFLPDLARALDQPEAAIDTALWELVAAGLVTGDGIAGLRQLLRGHTDAVVRATHLRPVRGGAARRLAPAGRWSLLRATRDDQPPGLRAPSEQQAEDAARRLLLRWGVVFRDVLARERRVPAWRELLAALRRLEARGEIRGGRFVDGFVGEQFALPEAVDALRSVRRRPASDEVVRVSVTYCDGVPIAPDMPAERLGSEG